MCKVQFESFDMYQQNRGNYSQNQPCGPKLWNLNLDNFQYNSDMIGGTIDEIAVVFPSTVRIFILFLFGYVFEVGCL